MTHYSNHSEISRKDIFSLLLSLWYLFGACPVSAQINRFDHYQVSDGLSQSVILSVFQDSDGFIWFGTQSGLNRYDGYEFVNYFNDPLNPNSLSNNWIYDIAEDNQGFLYLATKGGLNKYDKKTGLFSRLDFPFADSLSITSFIYGLCYADSILYINTPPSLIAFNTASGEFEKFRNNFEHPGTVLDIGSRILRAIDGRLWIASYNGLACFDPKTQKFSNFSLNQTTYNIASNAVTALFEEADGNILAGTENGLFLIRTKTNETFRLNHIEQQLHSTFVRAVCRDHEGNLWVASEGGGLAKLSIDKEYRPLHAIIYRHSQAFVSHDIIYSLFTDRSNNLWIGTIAGLDKLNLKKTGANIISTSGEPQSYNILDNVIASVYKDHSGRLWVGNWGKGLNILSGDRNPNDIRHYTSEMAGSNRIPENHVHVIFEDSKGRILIGTRDGVSVYRPFDQSFQALHEFFDNPDFNCFGNIRVYCMMEDLKGKIWIGTGNGIRILDTDANTIRAIRAENEEGFRISSNLVYSIMEEEDGEIWIATAEGLNLYNPKTDRIQCLTHKPSAGNSLCNNYVISLYQDKQGLIWIGTGSGLNLYSKEDSVFQYFSRTSGLPSEIIYNITGDNKGNIWLTTGRGLVFTDPSNPAGIKFAQLEQLQGKEFNLKAVYTAEDGELFFGGMDGLYSFYPDSLQRNLYIPPVKITSIEKENNGVLSSMNNYLEVINLSYHDYAFTIEFSALDFTSPGKNKYMYRMEGISNKWIKLGERRFVHFTNLRPGSYIFRVKGSNSDGVWNEEPTSLGINISPPWWASNYAYLVYLLILAAAIRFVIYFRERALRREKKRLEIEVLRRTGEITREKQHAQDSEENLRSTINSLDDILFVLDEKGRLQEFHNPKKRKTHFIFPEMHMGKHFTEISFPEDVIEQFRNAYETFGNCSKTVAFDHQFNDNGKTYWYNTKLSPKRNLEGELAGFVIAARDITDRKESEELLTKQKEKLDELNTTKDRFFSILAHDLKNPFTNLYSLSELLVKNYHHLEEIEKREALQKIHKSSGFIYDLLENLLTWSRAQRGKIDFNPVSFDLQNIIEENINLQRLSAEKKDVKIVCKAKGILHAHGDREMVNTVMRNLLNNAVKFSNSGGQIDIDAKKQKDHFVVSVKDEGVGISVEDQRKLFRLDEKYKSTGTAGETGTGLGLVICKEFMEKHGEKIWCESKVNKGTIFHFSLAST